MANNITSVSHSACTGCAACQNICPVDAISMLPDSEGFIMPVIDNNKCINCGKCLAKCPATKIKYINSEKPNLYAVRANDEIRAVSSSGGMFTVLAEEILSRGGSVCGAAFDDNLSVNHIIINSIDELYKLRGSKYVQSNINLVYRDIKTVLDSGRDFLFTGMPCQVAALYNFLGKDYDNLYTMDLLCHGVPSQKILSKYLDEIRGDKVVKNVLFRDKRNGWRSDLITVEFNDNTTYIGNMKDDTYELGFQHSIFLRKSCAVCNFSKFPRQADISVGDFWDINQHDISQNDKKGTSIVFVNNKHGQKLFEIIKPRLFATKEMNIPYDDIQNRIRSVHPHHKHRDRVFKLLEENHSLKESVKMTKNEKYDVGIVGIYTVGNFGGALTYYALYHVVKDLGYSVLMIERPKNSKHKPGMSPIYVKDPYPKYEKAPFYDTKQDMHELNKNCDTFLVGSDQMFNDFLYHQFGEWVTLDWVDDNKKKLAYAASFGHDYIWQPENTRAEMSYFMKKFDAFSVREESGVRICDEDFGVNAEWVLDPVFLCDRKYYEQLIEASQAQFPENYLGAYILDLNIEKQNIVNKISDRLSLTPQVFSEMNYQLLDKNGWTLPILDSKFINDRLANIAFSDFFVADSFHGICVAIIFRKNFVAILNKTRGASRFISILSKLGLEDRLIESENDINDHIFEPIDYDKVYKILDNEKERCIKWLSDALSEKHKKSYSDYDYWKNIAHEQDLKIAVLNKQNIELERNISTLSEAVADLLTIPERFKSTIHDKIQLRNITDIYEYLKKLKLLSEKYTIVMTVKDNIGLKINESISSLLNQIGFRQDFYTSPKLSSYVGIIDSGMIMVNNMTYNGPTSYSSTINGVYFNIASKLYKQGNSTSIKIGGKECAVNNRCLNIVVYHSQTHSVIDSVAFDTHVSTLDCYRK